MLRSFERLTSMAEGRQWADSNGNQSDPRLTCGVSVLVAAV
jgi:hypothetical protein